MFNLHRHSYDNIGAYYAYDFKMDGYIMKIYMLKSCTQCGKCKKALIDKIYSPKLYSLKDYADKNGLKTKIELLKEEHLI